MLGVFVASSKAVLKTCTVVAAGGYSTRRLGILKTSVKDLGCLTINLLLPCLTASTLGRSITFDALAVAWVSAVFAVLHVLLGAACGVGSALFLKRIQSVPQWKEMVCSCAFGNASALPLALLPTVVAAAPVLNVKQREAYLSHAIYVLNEYSCMHPSCLCNQH